MVESTRISIIGSFRRFPEEIKEFAEKLESCGLEVLSPKFKSITKDDDGFVYFDTNNQDYRPEEIQMIALKDILQSDLVYIYNPKGYIGKTTSYEIGFCFSKQKRLFYLDEPKDLPIPVHKNQIVKPSEFLGLINNNSLNEYEYTSFTNTLCIEALRAYERIMNPKEKSDSQERFIVICGSMNFFDEMLACKKELESQGINCIVPKDENNIKDFVNEKDFNEFKKRVSKSYLSRIRQKSTLAVLIYNETKNKKKNYIGANTQAELAMAFAWNKHIFLYDDIFTPLSDELVAWECVPLKKDFSQLIQFWNDNNKIEKESTINQLELF